jgi:hypothetical protein
MSISGGTSLCPAGRFKIRKGPQPGSCSPEMAFDRENYLYSGMKSAQRFSLASRSNQLESITFMSLA